MKLCAVVVFYSMVVYLGNFKYFCFKNRTNLDSMNNEVKVVLFDTFESFENLLPLSYTRPVADFRVGIMTIREKWEHYLPGNYSYKTTEYLGEKFPVAVSADEEAVFVAGNVLPDEDLAARVSALESGGRLGTAVGLSHSEAVSGSSVNLILRNPRSRVTRCREYNMFMMFFERTVRKSAAIMICWRNVAKGRHLMLR